jgi:hypothetical protein
MKILSWNILFLEHELKYNPKSQILNKYGFDILDINRSRDIVELILSFFRQDSNTIFCLQECSLKIMTELYKFLHNDKFFFYIRYRNQYLITITPKNQNFIKENHNFNPKISYGYLSIYNDNIKIINCHLRPAFAVKNLDVFKPILSMVRNKNTIIVGDYNEQRNNLVNRFSHMFEIPFFGNTYKNKQIDNMMLNFRIPYQTKLIDSNLISDHKIISISF